MDLQKKMKDIDEESTKTQNNVTNNALFTVYKRVIKTAKTRYSK